MVKEVSAGGVVYRRREGRLEIQLIEDRFGKMTIAKGKMEPGETIEQTALREIEEETGIVGKLIDKISVGGYAYEHETLGKVEKTVHYFLVEAREGEHVAQVEEIAGVGWYSPDRAWELQRSRGYDNNNELVRAALDKLGHQVLR
ncbi:NUDIX hydrolase [Cohnella panacarvi]|uniref:NUDIX hydrolase n=1 Tax=Cohnella panacarvi TaxID=400776 RepID=UPI00047DBD9F|nr:NUDIX domain-containing protein [Cohnella panacarvi]